MNIKLTPEYEKNLIRVRGIVSKSKGDTKKMIQLAQVQTGRITNETKALYRGKVAESEGHHEIAEVFLEKHMNLVV